MVTFTEGNEFKLELNKQITETKEDEYIKK